MTDEARKWLDEWFPFNEAIAVRKGWSVEYGAVGPGKATSPRGVTYQLDHGAKHAMRVAS